MLDLRRLALLREVALSGSIVGAARALGMSSSAISQQITRLERDTGVSLLEPVGRGVRVTPIGERLVRRAERALEELEAAEADLIAADSALIGHVRIAAYSTFAASMLPVLLDRVAARHPGLEIEFVQLDPGPALDELVSRRADLIVTDEYGGFALPVRRGLIRTELTKEPIAIVLPPGHAIPAPDTLASVLGDAAWVLEPEGSPAASWARGVCRDLGFDPVVRFESPELHVHRALISQGHAVGLLPAPLWGSGEERLTLCPSAGMSMSRRVACVMRTGSERRPGVQACLSELTRLYAEAD